MKKDKKDKENKVGSFTQAILLGLTANICIYLIHINKTRPDWVVKIVDFILNLYSWIHIVLPVLHIGMITLCVVMGALSLKSINKNDKKYEESLEAFSKLVMAQFKFAQYVANKKWARYFDIFLDLCLITGGIIFDEPLLVFAVIWASVLMKGFKWSLKTLEKGMRENEDMWEVFERISNGEKVDDIIREQIKRETGCHGEEHAKNSI